MTETSGVADWVLNGSVTTTTFAGSPLTIAQRNALTASAGDLVYVNDGLTNEYQFYNGTAWVAIGSGGSSTVDLTIIDGSTNAVSGMQFLMLWL